MQPQPERSWWSRNWKWFVPTGCLGLILIGVGIVIGILALVFGAIKSSDVYQTALEKARASPAVAQELGRPLEPGWIPSGSIKVEGASGEADLAIPVSGSLREGTIYATASKRAGTWRFTVLEVEVEGRPDRIDLLDDDR